MKYPENVWEEIQLWRWYRHTGDVISQIKDAYNGAPASTLASLELSLFGVCCSHDHVLDEISEDNVYVYI